MTTATVITDASHCPKQLVGGWAAWVRVDGMHEALKAYGVLKGEISDATVAEIYAALNGVWVAVQYGATDILVRSDCKAVIDLIDKSLPSKRLNDVWNEATGQPWFAKVNSLSGRHVRGHGKIVNAATFCNSWVDKQAGFAMREARKGRNCFKVMG